MATQTLIDQRTRMIYKRLHGVGEAVNTINARKWAKLVKHIYSYKN